MFRIFLTLDLNFVTNLVVVIITSLVFLLVIVFDSGTEFMAGFAKMCHNDYGLKRKPITTRNPQSNAIIERIHQTIGNIIRTFDVSNIVNNDPWLGILAATMFSVRATYHTTLQASPMQLVFGQDAILNIKHVADWEHIRQRKKL